MQLCFCTPAALISAHSLQSHHISSQFSDGFVSSEVGTPQPVLHPAARDFGNWRQIDLLSLFPEWRLTCLFPNTYINKIKCKLLLRTVKYYFSLSSLATPQFTFPTSHLPFHTMLQPHQINSPSPLKGSLHGFSSLPQCPLLQIQPSSRKREASHGL